MNPPSPWTSRRRSTRSPSTCRAAGCDVLQLDEPAMTRYPGKVFAYGAKALDRCLEGVQVPTFVHLCFGYPGGLALQHQFAYPELLEALLATRIGGLTVEFAHSNFDPAASLKVCRDRLVMFGCIDPGGTPEKNVDAVKARVRLTPAISESAAVAAGPRLRIDDHRLRSLAREKLGVMVEAARQLRRGCSFVIRPNRADKTPACSASRICLQLVSGSGKAALPWYRSSRRGA